MKNIIRKIGITSVIAKKDIGNKYEAVLACFLEKNTDNCGIILLLMKRSNGSLKPIAISDPVMNDDGKAYAFLDVSADDVYVSAEVRNGWCGEIVSSDYNAKKSA